MSHQLVKISVCFILGLALAACCPKEGVDKSFTVNDYAVAVDYYSQGAPIAANLIPKNDTYVELFDKDAQSEKPIYLAYDDKQSNRIIYYFSSSWNSEKINFLNVKFSNFEFNNINFNTIEKASFQREAKPFDQLSSRSVSYLDQIECVIKSVSEVFLPRAQAMSCKASASSAIYYRAGTLIRVDLD